MNKEYKDEVLDYLDINVEKGDLVHCFNCGEVSLHQVGGTCCGNCEEENIEVLLNNVSRQQLIDDGYLMCDSSPTK